MDIAPLARAIGRAGSFDVPIEASDGAAADVNLPGSTREEEKTLAARRVMVACLLISTIDKHIVLIARSRSWRMALALARLKSRLDRSDVPTAIFGEIERIARQSLDMLESSRATDRFESELSAVSGRLERKLDVLFSSRLWRLNLWISGCLPVNDRRCSCRDWQAEIQHAVRRLSRLRSEGESFVSNGPVRSKPFRDLRLQGPRPYRTWPGRKRNAGRQPLVSVVIPVLDKADRVDECLQSLTSDRHSNLEIIAVSDGSTGDNLDRVSLLAGKDSRIDIKRMPLEGGAGLARNIGLSRASGKYVMFVDSDDVVRRNAIHDLVEIAEFADTDIIRGRVVGIDDENRPVRLALEHLLHDRDAELVRWQDTESLWMYRYFTANLYRREFLLGTHLYFPMRAGVEDSFFLCRCFLSTARISLFDDVVYHHRAGDGQSVAAAGAQYLWQWVSGNYYLYQLLGSQRVPAQYFLVHFQGLRRHSRQIARTVDRETALFLLRHVSYMFRDVNIDCFRDPREQPWTNKREVSDSYVELIDRLTRGTVAEYYDHVVSMEGNAESAVVVARAGR